MNFLRLLACAWSLSLLGCATSITSNEPTDQPESEIVQAIQGTWFLEEHAPRRHPMGLRAEFEFRPDHSFIYTLVDYTPSCEQRDSYTGTWRISKGHLIQNWPKISANRPHATTSKILQINASKMLILSSVSTYDYYYRQPKVTTW
jgi:hypothetical protein